jgi:hypothetical protein
MLEAETPEAFIAAVVAAEEKLFSPA